MNEKFTQFFSLEKNLYAEGVPVIIKEGILLKDNDNDKLLIQLQMLNICKQPIKAVKLKIIGCDTFEQQVYTQEFQYIDMIAQSNTDFGSQTMLTIDDQTVRSFTVELVQVLFDDKTSWYGKGEKFIHIPDGVTIDEYLQDKELKAKEALYEKALNLYSLIGLEYVLKAKSIFEELGDFRDSSKRVQDCDNKINKMEEERREQEEHNAELAEQAHAAAEQKKIRNKKICAIAGVLSICCILIVLLFTETIIPTVRYNTALKLYKNGDYMGTLRTIKHINKCKDSKGIIKDCLLQINTGSITNKINFISYYNVVAVQLDGTVVIYQDETGTGETFKECDVSNWTDIIAISSFGTYTGATIVGLKSDGTVIVTGKNSGTYNLDISKWTDVVGIAASDSGHIIGLKSDGTVVATGNNDKGQCDVSDWNNIISVSAKYSYTAGLKANGRMVAIGNNKTNKCNVSEWRDIENFAMDINYTVGIQSDGSIVKVGTNHEIDEILDWKDISNIETDGDIVIGLKSDGTVTAFGIDSVLTWTDIVAIWINDYVLIGLKSDGTFITMEKVSKYNAGSIVLSDFTDIKNYN